MSSSPILSRNTSPTIMELQKLFLNSETTSTPTKEIPKEYLRNCVDREKILTSLKNRVIELSSTPLDQSLSGEKNLSTLKAFKTLPPSRDLKLEEACIEERRRLELYDDKPPQCQPVQSINDQLVLLDPEDKSLKNPLSLFPQLSFPEDNHVIKKRFEEANTYLFYPRNLIKNHEFIDESRKPNQMPIGTKFIVESILNGHSPIKKKVISLDGGFGILSIVEINNVVHVCKKWKNSKHRSVKTEQVANLCLAQNPAQPIAQVMAMTEDSLIMPLIQGRSLLEYFPTQPQDLVYVLKDILQALSYIEEKGFYYGDIKFDNFIRTSTSTTMIDFGFSREQEKLGIGYTVDFAAPEVLFVNAASIKADVFSLGIFLFYYLKGNYPENFIHNRKNLIDSTIIKEARSPKNITRWFKVVSEYLETNIIPGRDPTGELRALAKACLAVNPRARPSLADIQAVLDRLS